MPLYSSLLISMKESVDHDEDPDQTKPPDPDGKSSTIRATQTQSRINDSMRLLQDHIRSKKRILKQSTPSTQTTNKANKNLKDYQGRQVFDIVIEDHLHRPKNSEPRWDPEDEYDPMRPNSYELLMAEFLKAQQTRIDQMKSSKSSNLPSKNLMDVVDKLDEVDFPVGLVSSTSTNSCDRSHSDQHQNQEPVASQPTLSIGAKILSKMGYKVGQGLGKDQKGISSPLEVERCMGLNQGRILLPAPAPKMPPEQIATPVVGPSLAPESKQAKSSSTKQDIADLLRDSTRVLLLQNMVGPGEVDNDLEAETKEECAKYGEVIRCLIYEIPNKRVADEEAVRIFVEFKSADSAIKAVSDLNGRFFGGRVVRASFYNLDKFHRYQLGPSSTSEGGSK